MDPTERATVPIAEFFRLPGDEPERDNTLHPNELIVGIELPPSPYAEHSWYLKVRDRHSYAFALVSVAAGLRIVEGTIRAVGDWHGWCRRDAVARRRGRSQPGRQQPTDAAFRQAARLTMAGARPLSQNGFKVDLGMHSVVRALTIATSQSG